MTGRQSERRGWSSAALAALLLAVEAVVLAESWRGLTGFARLIGITGPEAWGVPVTLDGVALAAALLALRAELAAEPSGLYRVTLVAFTAASAAANYWHGHAAGGAPAAVYFGGMSIAVAIVFTLALRQIRREDRRRAGAVTERLPRFSPAHWARYPALTWRAWSLAVRDGHTTARAALAAARRRPDMTGPGADLMPAGADPGADMMSALHGTRHGAHVIALPSRSVEARATALIARDPGITGTRLARALGVSERHGRRLLARLASPAPAPAPPTARSPAPAGELSWALFVKCQMCEAKITWRYGGKHGKQKRRLARVAAGCQARGLASK